MYTANIKRMIIENANEIARMHKAMHDAHARRDESDEARYKWIATAAEFHKRYEGLAFPAGYEGALDRIIAGDAYAMESGLCFLEVRPFFFRSGYMFKDILRKLRKAPLSKDQRERLKAVETALSQWRQKKAA